MKSKGFLQRIFDASSKGAAKFGNQSGNNFDDLLNHFEQALDNFSQRKILKGVFHLAAANVAGLSTQGGTLVKLALTATAKTTEKVAKLAHKPLNIPAPF